MEKREQYTTTINSTLLKKLKIQAIIEGRNQNDILEECLKKYLEEKGEIYETK